MFENPLKSDADDRKTKSRAGRKEKEEDAKKKKTLHSLGKKTPMKMKKTGTPISKKKRSALSCVMLGEVSSGGGGVGKMSGGLRLEENLARALDFGDHFLQNSKLNIEVASPPQLGVSTLLKRVEQKSGHAGPEQAREGVCEERLRCDWTTPGGLVGSLTSCQTGQSQPGVGDASSSQGWGMQQAVVEPVDQQKP